MLLFCKNGYEILKCKMKPVLVFGRTKFWNGILFSKNVF